MSVSLIFKLKSQIIIMAVRIRFIQRKRPISDERDLEFKWLCSSLGFCQPKDRDQTASQILEMLIKDANIGSGLRSDDIAISVGRS